MTSGTAIVPELAGIQWELEAELFSGMPLFCDALGLQNVVHSFIVDICQVSISNRKSKYLVWEMSLYEISVAIF